MNSIVRLIFNEKLLKKRFVGPMNSAWDPLVWHKKYVWYMCFKTENCCLKTFMEILVGKKVCENTRNVIYKLKMIIWKHKPNTPKATEIEKHTSKKKKKNLKRWTWRRRRQSKHILRYRRYKIFVPLKPK